MSNWQQELVNGFSKVNDLLDFLQIDRNHGCFDAEQLFKTRVPLAFAERMQKGNLQDPLLQQVLASVHELENSALYSKDPLQEEHYNPMPGLIHKYHNRVLFVLTGACAVHCRYCFRRHFPYQNNNPGKKGWLDLRDYLQEHPEVNELILSGGDPLILSNENFSHLLEILQDVQTLKTIRIHSRIPIVLPSRIDEPWLAIWDKFSWQKVMVLHCNHAQELDDQVHSVVKALKQHGWTILNQSVLLKGINDHVNTLVELSQKLFSYGVMPYYLHLLDKVEGAKHFDIEKQDAIALYHQFQSQISGYLVPKLVQEIPGIPHKTLIS